MMRKIFSVLLLVHSVMSAPVKDSSVNPETQKILAAYKTLTSQLDESIAQVLIEIHKEKNRGKGLVKLLSSEDGGKQKNQKRVKILRNTLEAQIHEKTEILALIEELESHKRLEEIKFTEQASESITIKKSSRMQSEKCMSSPLPNRESIKLLRGFGSVRDSKTQIVWQHPGWLLETQAGPVFSCSNGTVAYAGQISGRGKVLIVEVSPMTYVTYAFLDDIPSELLSKGSIVKAGSKIGTTMGRLYFETRKNGTALNPSKFLDKALSVLPESTL